MEFEFGYFCRYIYRPPGNHSENVNLGTKLAKSFMCFAFIFIWHGLSWEVFLWSLFNFVGITLETLARCFGKSSYYLQYIKVIKIMTVKFTINLKNKIIKTMRICCLEMVKLNIKLTIKIFYVYINYF